MWIVIILGLLIFFFIIKPFLKKRNAENLDSYRALPGEMKILIEQEEVIVLAEILVALELERDYEYAKTLLDAIAYKGFGFSRRVDKIRNEMRIKAGLGSLKHF